MSAPIIIGGISIFVILAVVGIVIWLVISKKESKKDSSESSGAAGSNQPSLETSSSGGDAGAVSRAISGTSSSNSGGDSGAAPVSTAVASSATSSSNSSSNVTFASSSLVAPPTQPPPPPTLPPPPAPAKALPDVPVAAVAWGNNDQVFSTLINPKVAGYKAARLTSDMKLGFWWGTAGASDCTYRLVYRRPKASGSGTESVFEYGPTSYEARVDSWAYGSPTIYFEFNEDRDVSDINGAQLVLQKLDHKKSNSTFKDQFVFPDPSIKGYVYRTSAPSALAVLSQVRFKIAPAGAT